MQMGLFDDMQGQYDGFADSLKEQGIPVPSMTIILAIAAALLFAAYFLIAKPVSSDTANIEIKVLNFNNTPVDKAAVSIYDLKKALITEGTTGSDGRITFQKVPKGEIFIKAVKKGVGEANRTIQTTPEKLVLVIGNKQTASASVKIKLKVLDESTSNALEGATITYTFSNDPSKTYSAPVGSDGSAIVEVPADQAANLIVGKTNYDEERLTIPSKGRDREIEIKLRKNNSPAPTNEPRFEYGTLRVAISDSDGKPVDAKIRLFDAMTSSELDSKTASQGQASFPNLLTGSSFYVMVEAEGYAAYDGSLSPVKIGEQNRIDVTLRKGISLSGKLKVQTLDEDGNKISAKVTVISNDASILEQDSDGELLLDTGRFSSLESFTVAASADGRISAVSDFLFGDSIPAEVKLTLPSATDANSATLTISTRDKAGRPFPSATIKIYTEGQGLFLVAKSDSDASAKFVLQKDMNYILTAQSDSEKGGASVYLDGDKAMQIFIGAIVEQMQVSVHSAITDEPVQATIYSIYDDQTFDSCFGSSCKLFVKTMYPTLLRVTAEGYYDKEENVTFSGDDKVVNLIPLGLTDGFVKFEGIFNKLGAEVTEVETGQEYYAKLLVASPPVDKIGAYFRIGTDDKAEGDIAAIIGVDSSPAGSLTESKSFSPSSTCTNDNSAPSEYKWVNAEYSNAVSQEIKFNFKVKSKAETASQLQFYYRGYAAKGTEYFRFPADELLQNHAKVGTTDWCKAKTNEGSIDIRKTGRYSCGTLGCMYLSLEQDGMEGLKDYQARSAKGCSSTQTSDNPCDSYNMKIHVSFTPNDKSKEFDLKIGEQSAKVKLASFTLDNAAPKTVSTSSLTVPLTGRNEYNLEVDSLPMELGSERITATIEEAVGDVDLKKAVNLKIYASCGQGLKDCGGGRCEFMCFGDYYADGNDTNETIDPKPICAEGQEYCADGICRESCDISAGSDFTQEGQIVMKNGKISSAPIKLQIDSLVPADAVKLQFNNTDPKQCTPLYSISGEGTRGCYSIEDGYLVFRGNELLKSCPLKSVGDDAQGDRSAKLNVSCGGALSVANIPIEVSVNKINLKAVQFQPRSLSGSASKLFHIINEKQVGVGYMMEDLEMSFNFADAYTFAWSGAGTLELREDDKPVDSISYDVSDSYFPNVENQGGRATACYDYICCTSKWCSSAAASQAFLKFKETAKKAADATMFRRGDSYIEEKLVGKPFSFSTVFRLMEKSNLPREVRVEDTPSRYGCLNDNPKIYVVQASTQNGKDWQYIARIARLYKFGYVSSDELCRMGGMLPELEKTQTHDYQPGNNYLPLCNFLEGRNKCISSDSKASISTLEQVNSKRQMTPIPVPSSFWTAFLARATYCNVPGKPPNPEPHFDIPGIYPFPRWTMMSCSSGAAACTPKTSRGDLVTFNNQLYGVIHIGIHEKCTPDWVGAGIWTGVIWTTYKYEKMNKIASSLATLASGAIVGDFSSCMYLSAAAAVLPQDSKIEYAQMMCSLYSQNKEKGFNFLKGFKSAASGIASIFGGGKGTSGGSKLGDYPVDQNTYG